LKGKTLSEPESTRKEAERFYLLGLETVLKTGFGIYVSGPITTGRRFLSFWQRHAAAAGTPEYAKLFEQEVVRPNILAQQELTSAVANRLAPREVVIDPTVLPVFPDWTQADYHSLWAIVIERWVKRLVFADDWQYSSGCTWEFLVAHRFGLPVLDSEQRPIELRKAINYISLAVADIRGVHGNTLLLEQTLHELSSTGQPR
jgi:hypothetical protein